MSSAKYAFISAYLKGEEARVINSESIERVSSISNIQDALTAIRDTDIGTYFEELPVKTFDDLDKYLWGYLAQSISKVQSLKLVPKAILKLSKAYVVKYDVSNIKAALRRIVSDKKASMIPVGIIYNNGLLDELSNAENVDSISQLLVKCKLGDYVPALEQYKVDEGGKSNLLAEAKLDSEYYRNMLNVARRVKDGSVLAKAFGLVIDLTNLQIASRAIIGGIGPDAAESIIAGGYKITDKAIKELLPLKMTDIRARLEDTQYQDIASEISISYDKTKSITAVEETIDKHKFRMLKEMLSPRVLSPLVMAWYLVLKETEIRNLRLVLKAILDGVPVQEIRDFLVL